MKSLVERIIEARDDVRLLEADIAAMEDRTKPEKISIACDLDDARAALQRALNTARKLTPP